MLKFLAKIQFSIEMTMWLATYTALLELFKITLRSESTCSVGLVAKFPALTILFFQPTIWIRWWMIPIAFFALVVIEWKYSIPKWLQWTFKLSLFVLILITMLAVALPRFTLCSVIK